jgi:hypothetical protein
MCAKAIGHKFLVVALRRFSYECERDRIENTKRLTRGSGSRRPSI